MAIENAVQEKVDERGQIEKKVLEAKRRMLRWENPVEYVNNMYGCHPDNNGDEYFQVIYGGLDKENE